jgi:molecular chaperone GrpE
VEPNSEKEKNLENKETTDSNDIEELKKALAEEKSKCELNLSRWQRAQADFQNYKRYAEQEKVETCQFANVGLLNNVLPILDDLERALAAIPDQEVEHGWVKGIKLIDQKFRDTLKRHGVTPISALGMEFDPRFMEAITCGKGKKDMVVQELERGYKLNEKVIRPAKVIVGTGEEEPIKEE